MKLKFCDSDEFINIDSIFFEENRLYIVGNDIPKKEDVGFLIFNNDNSIMLECPEFTKIYDSDENFVAYVKEETLFNTFLLFDNDNLVYSQITVINILTMQNGYLYKSGYSKDCEQPKKIDLFDSNNINLYKIENGELIDTTDEDKETIAEKNHLKEQKDDAIRLEEVIQKKLAELNEICSTYITDGIDYNNEHYSYELSDQNNIYNCIQLANLTGYDIPYHANGEGCKLFSLEELMNIYILQEMNLTKHITYTNQLKQYVKSLTNISDIENVMYGQELSGEYLNTYQSIMEHSQSIATSIGKDVSNEIE